eukprot:15065882-Alexandrium_andersonii.AAC.1
MLCARGGKGASDSDAVHKGRQCARGARDSDAQRFRAVGAVRPTGRTGTMASLGFWGPSR